MLQILEAESRAFPKIYAVGKADIPSLFDGEVEVTEKLDGSQIGFGRDMEGNLIVRSKGRVMDLNAVDKLFKNAVDHIKTVIPMMAIGNFYYGEAITSPKHNTMSYGRTPKNFIALYGVLENGTWVTRHDVLSAHAQLLEIDVVPLIFQGEISNKEHLDFFLTKTSYLGKELIEGVVIKNYKQRSLNQYSPMCFGKYVRPEFKERNGTAHPTQKNDIMDFLAQFKSEARWNKAIQYLRDNGTLTNSLKDIGPLITRIADDVIEEEQEFIKVELYKMFVRKIRGAAVQGFPEFYKTKLTEGAFNVHAEDVLPSVQV